MNASDIVPRASAFFDMQDLFVFGGLVAVTVGAYQIYPPLGWIVPGAASMALGVRMAR